MSSARQIETIFTTFFMADLADVLKWILEVKKGEKLIDISARLFSVKKYN